ncbi:orotate phosphoribosyltransferase [bacterium]|nr:orotate phosphoribosyltransferase [bacterium]
MIKNPEFADFLLDEGVFQVGDFTLKSGQKSSFFLNFGDLCQGRQLARLGEFFARGLQELTPPPTLIFGPAYKGIPLAVSLAQAIGGDLGYFSFRKEAKTHGEISTLLGQKPRDGDHLVLIDDVITTSETKVEAMQQVAEYARAQGLKLHWSGVLVGVDRQGRTARGETWAEAFAREQKVPVHSLIKLEDLLQRARERGLEVPN